MRPFLSRRTIQHWARSLSLAALSALLILPTTGISISQAQASTPTPFDAQLAQWTVLHTNGKPFANAAVEIFVVPQPVVTAKAKAQLLATKGKPGSTITITDGSTNTAINESVAGTGTTDGQGHIHVAFTYPAATDHTNMSTTGYVNYELQVLDGQGGFLRDYYFTRYYGPNAQIAKAVAAMPAKTLVITHEPTGSVIPLRDGGPCEWYDTKTSKTTRSIIAEIHAENEFQGWVQYGQTADTNFGVAEKAPSSDAYSEDGSFHLSNSSSSTLRTGTIQNKAEYIRSDFAFKEQMYECTSFNPSQGTLRWVPQTWLGGDYRDGDLSYWDHQSAPSGAERFENGDYFETTNTTAFTYGGSVCLAGVLCVSAESGYSSSVVVHLQVNSSEGYSHLLYGQAGNGAPTQAPTIYTAW